MGGHCMGRGLRWLRCMPSAGTQAGLGLCLSDSHTLLVTCHHRTTFRWCCKAPTQGPSLPARPAQSERVKQPCDFTV